MNYRAKKNLTFGKTRTKTSFYKISPRKQRTMQYPDNGNHIITSKTKAFML